MSERYQIRKNKLEKALMQAISQIIFFEMGDERLKKEMISISRVELNDDLSQATVFFTCFNPENKNKAIKLLYQSAPYFRSLLTKKVIIRSIPQLKFFYDHNKGEDVADLIDKLSAQYRKNQDQKNKNR